MKTCLHIVLVVYLFWSSRENKQQMANFGYALVQWEIDRYTSVLPIEEIDSPLEIGQETLAKYDNEKLAVTILAFGGNFLISCVAIIVFLTIQKCTYENTSSHAVYVPAVFDAFLDRLSKLCFY